MAKSMSLKLFLRLSIALSGLALLSYMASLRYMGHLAQTQQYNRITDWYNQRKEGDFYLSQTIENMRSFKKIAERYWFEHPDPQRLHLDKIWHWAQKEKWDRPIVNPFTRQTGIGKHAALLEIELKEGQQLDTLASHLHLDTPGLVLFAPRIEQGKTVGYFILGTHTDGNTFNGKPVIMLVQRKATVFDFGETFNETSN